MVVFTRYERVNSLVILRFMHNINIRCITNFIKRYGVRWHPGLKGWLIPKNLDNPEFHSNVEFAIHGYLNKRRKYLEGKARRYTIHQKEDENTDELEKMFATPKENMNWICCMEATIIDWDKKYTSCSKCGVDGNNFRIGGKVYVPF